MAAKHVGRTYVCVDGDPDPPVLAYFTLAPHLVRRQDVPGRVGRGSPDAIPAILLARLALDVRLHAQGFGAAVLVDALERVVDAVTIAGGRLVVVDAIDARAAGFYEHFGFRRILGHQRLYRKVSDIARDLGRDPGAAADH